MFTVEEPEESHYKAFISEGFEGLTAIEVSTARATERTDKMKTINSPVSECIFRKVYSNSQMK